MSTPIADSIGHHAAPDPHAAPQHEAPMPRDLTRWERINRDMAAFGHAALSMAQLADRIVTTPAIEESVELLLESAGLGAEARDLAFVAAGLRELNDRLRAGTGPQPQFRPAPPADPDRAM